MNWGRVEFSAVNMSPKAHVLATIAGLALCTGDHYCCRDGALVRE